MTATRDSGDWIISTSNSDLSWNIADFPYQDPGLADDNPDIRNWTDPLQPKENVKANSAVTITIVGNTVTITGKIAFTGPGAGPHTDGRLLAHINTIWSGSLGQYTVTTNMTIGTGGIVINVVGDVATRPLTFGLGRSTIQSASLDPSLPGATEYSAAVTLQYIGHEFGHVLGLMACMTHGQPRERQDTMIILWEMLLLPQLTKTFVI